MLVLIYIKKKAYINSLFFWNPLYSVTQTYQLPFNIISQNSLFFFFFLLFVNTCILQSKVNTLA